MTLIVYIYIQEQAQIFEIVIFHDNFLDKENIGRNQLQDKVIYKKEKKGIFCFIIDLCPVTEMFV